MRKPNRLRIYEFKTHKAFTEIESELYNNKKTADLLAAIHNNIEVRKIDKKYLTEDNEKFMHETEITRLALADRNKVDIDDCPLVDEIVCMEIHHNEILWQIIENGIYIADKKYIFFSATTGQVRNNKVTLMREDFYEKHKGYLMVGLSKEQINTQLNSVKKELGMNVGKYLSYNALALSSSVLPEKPIDIDRCIVVKGLETAVSDRVKYIDIQTDSKGQCYVANTPADYVEKSIEIEHTDGAGMFLPGELPSSCQIRGGYFKGAMFPFDFRTFASDVAHNTVITDAWGNTVDIEAEDIRFIFTTSQLKMWKEYDSWTDYKEKFKNNGVQIFINKYAEPAKESVNFAYQYLQTLPYDVEISGLCKAAVEDINRLKTDIDYVKQELGFSSDTIEEDDCTDRKQSSFLGKALELYPPLINDSHVRKKVESMVRARRNSYRGGKIPISGYYSYIVPDLYAFCEFLFLGEDNPAGLILKNHVYNKYYDECGNVEEVICLRSPHLSQYEYPKRKLIKSDECREWFKYLESDTVVSCHDLISKSLQCDWDGDEVLITVNPELYRAARDLPEEPLYYEMQKAEAQIIDNRTIYETLVKGFDNNVIGDSSNAITKLWNAPALKDNPLLYDDAINVFCAYSNYAIDFPKTGKNLVLGEYEQLYKDLVPAERMKKSSVKYPAFFYYAKCKRSNLEEFTESPMDRIAKYVGAKTGSKRYKYSVGEFDYSFLMNNECGADGVPKYEINRKDDRYKELYSVINHRKKKKQEICANLSKGKIKNIDCKETAADYDLFHYYCIREIKKIFTDKEGVFNVNLAVNYYIDMEYRQSDFISTSKDILWKCFGHVIVDNIHRNLNDGITLKERPRMAYRKAEKGIEALDDKIAEMIHTKSVEITDADLNFMDDVLKKKKNGKYYNNDRELLFALLCIYKYKKLHKELKDEELLITKKKHYTKNDNGRKKKSPAFNMNSIMKMTDTKSFASSFQRFVESNLVQINLEGSPIRIKMSIPDIDTGNKLFTVEDIYNPMVYLDAYNPKTNTMKKLEKCVMCGKHFIRNKNNTRTCGEDCRKVFHKMQVDEYNKTATKKRTVEI